LIGEQALLRSAAENGELPVAREQRKLAPILAADGVGYSRLMGCDESGALAGLAEISLPDWQRLHHPVLALPASPPHGPRQRPTSALYSQP